MVYKSFLPSPQLSAIVRNYTIIRFQFDIHQSVPAKPRAPKPEQKIVFYIKGSVNQYNVETGGVLTPPPVAVFTHQLDRKNIQVSPEFFALIIFLQPGALHRMIRLPVSELLQEYCCDAELFFGTEVRFVSEQLAEADSLSDMVAIAEQFMLAKCKQLEIQASVDTVATELLSDPTCFSLDWVAEQACLSTKQFRRKFTQRIGMSPKLFSRLSRFNHAYRYKLTHPDTQWSSIAQEFSYTDYHHMEKEFKQFTGLTPQEWFKAELSAPERILKLR
ncbi:AraC family transcriptional regulator [Fulvivirgaceae bacterium PWU4]|uniref:AraC family transcriptional regulator n=1 Tax=Chryseosolibacter histidini TaxID=2782349 RepID=A0AAP2DKU5_9BACT|nr:helix-turn-helix domain-containing protein [Chryseosolibacter histidini]MBT1697354.1 AraC family transcriptional regulator [Chryseosolibacter histidini]